MGIQDCYAVLKEYASGSMVTVKLDDLFGIRVAVDISIWFNKYIKTVGPTAWISNLFIFICQLKKCGIQCTFIFDGPNPPPEKKEEQNRRRAEAAKKKEKIAEAKKLAAQVDVLVKKDAEMDEELADEIKRLMNPSGRKSKIIEGIIWGDPFDVHRGLLSSIDKWTLQNQPILPIYGEIAREMLSILGLSWIQAPGEAETLCCALAIEGIVDAVLSEDTDCICYGTPFLLSKLDLGKKTVMLTEYSQVLKEMDFTEDQFTDLLIMLGCDYNQRVKGYPPDGKKHKKPVGLGMRGAYHMINTHKSIEAASEYIVDTGPLNYRRCRELFTAPTKKELPDLDIAFNKPVDQDGLEAFIAKHKCTVTVDYVMGCFKPAKIVFESDEQVDEDEEDDFE